MNTVNIVGRLTRDPELKTVGSGTQLTNFSIAVGRKFKKDEVDFFDCIAWGKTAELIVEYIQKGDQIGITGALKQDVWEKDGKKSSKVSINVESITFIGGKKAGLNGQNVTKEVNDDELPF